MLLYLGIYLGFLSVVSVIYYAVKENLKHIVLFAASISLIAFISWKVALYVFLFSTFNYIIGLNIEKYRSNASLKLRIFWSAIAIDILFLSFFKYFNLLRDGINSLFALFSDGSHWNLIDVIIPLGISYYTFQALGYVIRINRGSEKPEPDYFKFLTYLVFFPKFFSGPVERSNHFFPQLKTPGIFRKENIYDGLRLILWGAFKKGVIATALYEPVHLVYSNVHLYSGIQLIAVFILQTIYIYTEFSGYTDMALGSAKIMGINLVDNFNRPFLARNVSEFWRRWHISLSSWCNDFIYSPFIVKYRRYENLAIVSGVFLTFLVIGVWHAANWTFVVLGFLQGLAIVYEFYTKKYRLKTATRYPKSFVNTFSRIIVFLFACLSMVFFFSPTISDAWYILSHLFDFESTAIVKQAFISDYFLFGLALLSFTMIFIAEMLNEKGKNLLSLFLKQPFWFQWAGYIVLILLIILSDPPYFPIEYMKF